MEDISINGKTEQEEPYETEEKEGTGMTDGDKNLKNRFWEVLKVMEAMATILGTVYMFIN